MERIRVMTIIARMNVGGPAVQIAELDRGLDRERFDHRLVTGFCAADEADFIDTQAPDIQALRVPGLGRAVRPLDDLRTIPSLARAIKDFDPHVVHTHTAKAGVLGRLAAKAARTDAAVVHTYHGHLLHGYFSSPKTHAVTTLERALARGTDRIVTVGSRVRDDLLAAGVGRRDQYQVIAPGVSLGPLPDLNSAREILGLPLDRPVVAMIGRITGIKRPDRFLAAVRTIAAQRPDAIFLVAGSGDQEAALATHVAREELPVTMLGWRSDVEVLLAASDALVLTSDNEGTPISLIQAGLAGIPVVATDVGSVNEVVVNGATGILCTTQASDIATGLLTLLADPGLARTLGEQARAAMSTRFSVERMVAEHAELYLRLAA